jgi:NTE family protein
MTLIRFIFISLLLAFSSGIKAQAVTEDSLHKKKIGLVLSGGGAKGMAHIGLLKLMDSLNLNVGIIGGTSMGSIMGSLYAIGYSGEEIEKRCRAMNWNHLFSDRIPFEKITIEEKLDQNRYLLELPFKNGKLKLPAGMISGPNLYNELVKLTFPVIDKPDWDSFPIPLRINAVNILAGNNVVFKSGFLPPRMRASMSIPSIFLPISLDSSYYIDGGVVRNILIPEVKAGKPDFMIGSYTGGNLMGIDDLNTLPKLMGQTFTIYGILDAMNEMKELNLISKPNLAGLDAGSFAKAGTIIQRGIESVGPLHDTLIKLAQNPAYQRTRPISGPHDDEQILHEQFYVDEVNAKGIQKTTQHFFTSTLDVQAGDTTCLQHLFDGVLALYGSMHYDFVTYTMDFKGYTPQGRKIISLNFTVSESPNLAMRFAINYNSDNATALVVGLLGRNILFKNTRLLAEINISEKPRGKFSYFWYADKRLKWILGTTHYYEENNIGNYSRKNTSELFRVKAYNNYTWLQYKFSYRHNLSLGYEFENQLLKPKIYSDTLYDWLESIRTNQHGALLQYEYNSLNRVALPTKGLSLVVKARYMFGSQTTAYVAGPFASMFGSNRLTSGFDNYPKLSVFFQNYSPFTKRLSWINRFYGATIILDGENNNDVYYLGSVERNQSRSIPLYGYRFGEIGASSFALAETGLQLNAWKDLYLSGGVQAAQFSTDYKDFFKNFTDVKNKTLGRTSSYYYSISYMIPRLGPVAFTVHKSFDRSLELYYFSIGYRFATL